MPEFSHKSVLAREVVAACEPRSGGLYLDGTIGGGGHAALLLEASAPGGRLIGLDRDAMALAAARERLAPFAGRFELHQANFEEMERFTPTKSCDAVLLDLGVSSPQLDLAERGFSFQQEGPLDMRMDQDGGLTAAEIVNTWPAEDLARIFWELGEERHSRRLARAIEKRRMVRKFETTRELADLIETEIPRRGQRTHPATRVFQALRMAVNHELESLDRGLAAAWAVLKEGGRLCVITFHSLEDRKVKEFGRELCREYDFPGEVDVPELRVPRAAKARWISRKAIIPSEQEVLENPRARSAQLRVLAKLEGGTA